MQALSIKETMDVLVAAEALFDGLVKAADDGKFSILDLRHVVVPARAAAEAVRGADKIRAEIKDADAAEMDALVAKVAAVAERAAEAFAAVSGALGK